ncbi:MAG: hypothetical protein HOO88_05920 [Kiritimatiellaceae bacterium]|nr:hypothetical protein [Kiritimatiellaceae bacterium]
MKLSKATVVAAIMLIVVRAACGNSIFSENFESYEPGSSISRQNGFTTVDETAKQKQSIVEAGSFFNGGSKSLFYSDKDNAPSLLNLLVVNKSIKLSEPVVFSFDYNVLTNVQNPSLTLFAGTKAILSLNFFNVTGTVRHRSAEKLEDVASYKLSTGLWYHVEITMGDLSGSSDTYDLRILEGAGGSNGTEVINVKGLAFRNKGAALTHFQFGTIANAGTGGCEFYLDNIQIAPLSEQP